MPAALRPIPPTLIGRPVTWPECRAAGLSRSVVHRRFTALFRGVWWFGAAPTDIASWLRAARLVLPADAVVSHVTALHLFGISIRPVLPLHLSTGTSLRTRQDSIVLHRRQGRIPLGEHRGLPVTSAERAFVDAATQLGIRDLVRVGDALLHRGLVTMESLWSFCFDVHTDGVVRARMALKHVRNGVESFLETDVRMLLTFARLPVDGCNVDIHDEAGRFVARGDILFGAYKVLVEYDGWHHERDARQRQKDHLRRERLEAAGWIVIVVTIEDLKNPLGIVQRVHRALLRRGYDGRRPIMSDTWARWFTADAA